MTGRKYYKYLCAVYVENQYPYDHLNEVSKEYLEIMACNVYKFSNLDEYISYVFTLTENLWGTCAVPIDDAKTRANHSIIYNLCLFDRHLNSLLEEM